MFQIITTWNLYKPDKETEGLVNGIELRGYNHDKVDLTSQFANKISDGSINALTVDDIVYKYCPARRDLYYEKGSNKAHRVKSSKTWGRVTGHFSQEYLAALFELGRQKNSIDSYNLIDEMIREFSSQFMARKKKKLGEIRKMATDNYELPNQLIQMLKTNGRIDMGAKLMHGILSGNGNCAGPDDISYEYGDRKVEFSPNPIEIGISKSSTPDFIIEKFKIVGDFKTGVHFDERLFLTCAGYALAYENWKKANIDWGIICFVPTRIPTNDTNATTNSQLYVFPLNDQLRKKFLDERDNAYGVVSEQNPRNFPKDHEVCKKCYKYKVACSRIGGFAV